MQNAVLASSAARGSVWRRPARTNVALLASRGASVSENRAAPRVLAHATRRCSVASAANSGSAGLAPGDHAAAAGDYVRAEACYMAAADAAVCGYARAVARQRMSAVLLARAAEGGDHALDLVSRALEASSESLATNPQDPLARFSSAAALVKLGRLPCAIRDFRRLLDDTAAQTENGSTSVVDVRLHAHASLTRCFAMVASTALDVSERCAAAVDATREATATRKLLAELPGPCHGPRGALELEMELLACAARVEASSMAIGASDAGAGTEAADQCGALHSLPQWTQPFTTLAEQTLRELGEQSEIRAALTSQRGSATEVAVEHEPLLSATPEPTAVWPLAFEELISRLTWVANCADREDHYDLLWQALAWRSRSHILARNWHSAAADATKALQLNVFSSAELEADDALRPLASSVSEHSPPVPPSLLSPWACLRICAVANGMLGRRGNAMSDVFLLHRLVTPPPQVHAKAPVPWSNSRAAKRDNWQRDLKQKAALRSRQRFQRDGVFALPASF
mmetsp:Transcript_95475/g.269988  ORF Transcript_95475/g.269988 Transcript_95475/m.269988 type:complete len:515 (-) Transcript_95475:140-1684(-)